MNKRVVLAIFVALLTNFISPVEAATKAVKLSGTVIITYKNPSTLTTKKIATTPNTAKVSYQWFKGPFEIKGATTSTYPLSTSDEGSEISLSITATAKGYSSVKSTSKPILIALKERKYLQIWSDEFNPDTPNVLDQKVWKFQNGDGTSTIDGSQLDYSNVGWGNRERQFYTPSQSKISGDGILKITAERNLSPAFPCYFKAPCDFISSRIITDGLLGFKYGRVEAKLKGPAGKGSWGAFWLLGARCNLGEKNDPPWPRCGEIDIAEPLGRAPTTVYGTLHGPFSGGGGRGGTTELESPASDGFHTYAIDWLPDQVTWYVDGKAFATVNKTDKDWVFDHEMYLIFNLAMGGIFAGELDPKISTADMQVDWVRFSTINGVGELIQH